MYERTAGLSNQQPCLPPFLCVSALCCSSLAHHAKQQREHRVKLLAQRDSDLVPFLQSATHLVEDIVVGDEMLANLMAE